MSLLPLRGESTADPDEPRVVGLAGATADETFEVLSSATTREVLATLYEQPSTPSEVRDHIGTSLQNVHYHLGKLEDADLIEPAGVGYSEKGTEMTVYAPTSEAIVLFAGRRDDRSRLRSMLSRLFGIVVALGVGTAALRWFVRNQTGGSLTGEAGSVGTRDTGGVATGGSEGGAVSNATPASTDGGGGFSIASNEGTSATNVPQSTTGGASGTESFGSTHDAVHRTTAAVGGHDPTTIPQQVAHALATEPALAFLLGGVFVLCVVGVVWYTTR